MGGYPSALFCLPFHSQLIERCRHYYTKQGKFIAAHKQRQMGMYTEKMDFIAWILSLQDQALLQRLLDFKQRIELESDEETQNQSSGKALIVPVDTLKKADISADELLVDLGCYLYEHKRLSLGQARALTGLNQIELQQELAKREIDVHYTEEDLNKDLKNLGISI